MKLLAGASVLAVLLAVVLYGVFSEQLQTRFGGDAFGRGDPRPLIWAAALAQHATQPVLGAGARMFYEGCITYRTGDSPGWMQDAQFVHNDWLQMLSDYGWIGLLLLLVMLLTHLFNGWAYLTWFVRERFPRSASISSRSLGLVIGSIAALAALLVHAVFDFHFHVPATALTAALLLGLLANPGMVNPQTLPARVPGVRPLLKAGLLLAGVVMISGAVAFGRADYYAEKAGQQTDEEGMTPVRISWLTKAIEADPRNATAWYERGLAGFDSASGQPVAIATPALALAIQDLTEARRLNPYNFYYPLALADAYGASGQHDIALQLIKEAHLLAPLYQAPRLALALHYHRLKQWQESERAYLWAMNASAEGNNDWYPLYQQMLENAARE